MNCSPLGSSVHEIFQARILEWVAIPFSGNLSYPGMDPASPVSPTWAGGFFTTRANWEAQWTHRTLQEQSRANRGWRLQVRGRVWRRLKRMTLIPRITISLLLSLPSVKSIGASELWSGCHSEPIADSRGRGCTVGQCPWGWTAKMRLCPQQECRGGLETLGHGTRGINFHRLLILKFSHFLL